MSPAYPTFSLLFCPHPPDPLPDGKGGIYSFLMQGAEPLASPRLSRKRHGLNLRDKCPEGARPLGRLPTLPLACFLAPIPPPALAERSSRREGGDYKFILPGAPPSTPRHQTVYGTDSPCRCSPPAGARPLCHLPPLPVALLLPPSPRPPSQREGGDYKFFCRGLRPLHPGVWTGRGTGSASIGDTRRGACVLVAGSPATATPGGVGQTKRGP